MEGCKVFLIFLIVLSYVTSGSSTKEDNVCYPDIPCDDRECIRRGNWCDGYDHCLDSTDEVYCKTKGYFSYPDNKCNGSLHFECANRKCVPIVLVCDGFDDCKDNSDEENCQSPKPDVVETVSAELPTSAVWTTPKPEDVTTHLMHHPDPRTTSVHLRHTRPYAPFPTTQVYHRQAYSHPYVPVNGPPASLSARLPVPNKRRRLSYPFLAFRFQQDHAQSFGRRYGHAVDRAERWLLGRSDEWGVETPRALVALSLAGNSFHSGATDYDVKRRTLKLDLGAKLLRHTENPMNDHLLAMYVNALMATCQDPRRVYNQDLVSLLYNRTHDPRRRTVPTPFVLLTLCIANSSVSNEDISFLENIVNSRINGEVSKDRFILSTSALACIHKTGLYANALGGVLRTASQKLLEQQFDDGSFGSTYSTALAAQAFFALDSNVWNPDKTLDYLLRQQLDDGSFGDMLATYYILPVLRGRSLVHLRNTHCEKQEDDTSSEDGGWEMSEPKKSIWYSLAIGREQRNPITWQMDVPAQASFFEIMQEAQKLHPRFRFLYTEFSGKIDVYTISGVPNDPEYGTYWQLHVINKSHNSVDRSQIYYGDIRNLIPEDNQELLYWYLPYKDSFY